MQDVLSMHPFSLLVSWCSSLSSISFEAVDRVDLNEDETTCDVNFATNQGDLVGATIQAYLDKKVRQLVASR